MAAINNERQELIQAYKKLNDSDRIIFKSILDMTIILLKNMQTANCKSSEVKSA